MYAPTEDNGITMIQSLFSHNISNLFPCVSFQTVGLVEKMYDCCISVIVHHAFTEYFYVVKSFATNFAGFDVSFDNILKFFMKSGDLFLKKIITFVATKCQILRLKCTEFNLGWGFAPDSAGELTALPRLSYI